MESQLPPRLRRHRPADEKARDRLQPINDDRRENSRQPSTARRRQPSRRSTTRSASTAPSAAALRGRPRKVDAKGPHETGCRERRGQSKQHADRPGSCSFSPIAAVAGCTQNRSGKSAIRRRSRSTAAAPKSPCYRPALRPRKRACAGSGRPAARWLRSPGRHDHRAGAEEQQAFEQRVVHRVEQRRGQRKRRRPAEAARLGMPGRVRVP